MNLQQAIGIDTEVIDMQRLGEIYAPTAVVRVRPKDKRVIQAMMKEPRNERIERVATRRREIMRHLPGMPDAAVKSNAAMWRYGITGIHKTMFLQMEPGQKVGIGIGLDNTEQAMRTDEEFAKANKKINALHLESRPWIAKKGKSLQLRGWIQEIQVLLETKQ